MFKKTCVLENEVNIDMKNDTFEKLVKKHSRKLYNYLLKTLRNKEDAEDILQETLLAFYQKMDNVDKSAFKSYLFTTAYHKSLNLIRKRKKNKEISSDNLEFIPKREKPPAEKNQTITSALAQLKKDEAILIEMQYYQNFSYTEIAKALDKTVSAVDSKLVRTKRKLREIIKNLEKSQEENKIEVY